MTRSGAAFLVLGILCFSATIARTQPLKVPYVSVSPNPAELESEGFFKSLYSERGNR